MKVKEFIKEFFKRYGFTLFVVGLILLFDKFKIMIGSGTSMLPTFKEKQVTLCMKQSSYEIGDVVYYRIGKFPIAHRIIDIHTIEVDGMTVKLYTMKGDNNPVSDYFQVYDENIVCKIIWH